MVSQDWRGLQQKIHPNAQAAPSVLMMSDA